MDSVSSDKEKGARTHQNFAPADKKYPLNYSLGRADILYPQCLGIAFNTRERDCMVERVGVEEGVLSAIILHFLQLEGRRRIVRKWMIGEKSRLMGSRKAEGSASVGKRRWKSK
jgi:hypothetical protein